MKIKIKALIGILIIILSFITISVLVYAAEESIEITLRPTNENTQILIDVKSKENIKLIKIYKKIENGNYILFYQANNVNKKDNTYSISHNRLSEEKETYIRVVVRDEKGNQVVKDITLPKYQKPTPTPQVSPTPTPIQSPTPVPTQSTAPAPTQSPAPTPTPSTPPTNQEISISLDKNVLMLDKNHYNFSILKATVKPTNAKVTFSSSNTKVVKVNSETGKIDSVGYGTANVVATATLNGVSKKATCQVRVIVPMTDKTSDSGAFKNYKENGATYRTYYIRYYNPTTKKINTKVNGKTVSQHWSDAEVESYVNNAEWLVKNYPDKFGESKELTYYYYPNYGNPNKYVTVTKPKGELVTKGGKYILLFTTKNQCLYLLKKNSNGKWKLDTKIVSSGGYYWDLSKKDGVSDKIITYANGDAGLALHPHSKGKPATSKVGYTNAFHLGVVPGYPTSGGCTHIGKKITDPMAKRLKQVFVNDKQLIKVLYY